MVSKDVGCHMLLSVASSYHVASGHSNVVSMDFGKVFLSSLVKVCIISIEVKIGNFRIKIGLLFRRNMKLTFIQGHNYRN